MSYEQNTHQNPYAYVSPQQVMLNHGQPMWHPNGAMPGQPMTDSFNVSGPGHFAPGVPQHTSFYHPHPTPHSVLTGTIPPPRPNLATHQQPREEEAIVYIPRRREYSDHPTLTITFSVQGRPAPYLKDLWEGKVTLDGANDRVFASHGWRLTRWAIDWPGFNQASQKLYMHDASGKDITRATLANEIIGTIGAFMQKAKAGKHPSIQQRLDASQKNWSINRFRFGHVRLVALNYYQSVWIPVLAVDHV